MPSIAYSVLSSNIAALKLILPPSSPSGTYTQTQEILIRAFTVLSHAELEHYFESRCREIVVAYQNGTNITSGAMIRSRLVQYFSVKNQVNFTPYNYVHISICKAYDQMIISNNGIKESNLFKLLWPLGIDGSMIPSTLLPDLDSYGSRRGALVHNGLHYSIQFVLDPLNEISAIDRLLQDIFTFDAELDKLLL
jgi:hypothetical protein